MSRILNRSGSSKRNPWLWRALILVLASGGFLGAGCKQGAGERCQVTADCDDGLMCQPSCMAAKPAAKCECTAPELSTGSGGSTQGGTGGNNAGSGGDTGAGGDVGAGGAVGGSGAGGDNPAAGGAGAGGAPGGAAGVGGAG